MKNKIVMWQKCRVLDNARTRCVPEAIGKVIWALPPKFFPEASVTDPFSGERFITPEGNYCLTNVTDRIGVGIYLAHDCLEFIKDDEGEWLKERVDFVPLSALLLNP